MMEEWKHVTSSPQRTYSVSNWGRVRSTDPKTGKYRILKFGTVSDRQNGRGGYPVVCVLGTIRYVHQWVAEAFLGPRNGREVDHINGNKQDNRACNLEWVTKSEQHHRAWQNGAQQATADGWAEKRESIQELKGALASNKQIAVCTILSSNLPRDEKIDRLRNLGLRLTTIGDLFSLSKQRIQQVVFKEIP